ncbi:bifunctional diaminohydroxyphosphoribosylaminopyrimidine deaminase/5-amino-6-(5-phosphoribosylamino)uracil reductase RibD [Kocuria sp.]|uniref:bifunctional diaminohydroxyphosphoribosylaminopyrimidine deaminase/5-amino-6-(5-phosphoribosylamino)uracil reductase RibD n=1 Tax=Kocuria sp. TaxID=1871328 RepID=UPI0026DD6407|nr:bifunctional diaminohydroxyphosphoribosylaminopyrimidine deaminase/5-amino-6-(5-phosphoribosylamino)uracil reductase RibD [Kocuria sp.]MDO4918394.1 bifunctional diaminohydroxyphosphoribosylaminopyrimidine deaminase/5-amino-6-(5-phosphoribosylamino)uracil reductase RibD [Kocuria sp.]
MTSPSDDAAPRSRASARRSPGSAPRVDATSTTPGVGAGPFTAAEETAMRGALEAARLGVRGANPVVGAAILSSAGEVLHVGHHRGAGTDHAEVAALRLAREAGTDLRDTTMVVTLEPCHHTGRTGPCSEAVAAAGIPRLVYAVGDSTDAARGGAAALVAEGLDVRAGLLADEALALNERWFRAQAQHRPFVSLKIAQTLDGRVAAADGTSRWITGQAARAEGHALRARVDAILVGGGTLRADDPSLTARDAAGAPVPRQPLRAVMSTRPVPEAAAVRRGVVGASAAGADGRFVHLATHDPREALSRLRDLGAAHVLVEGGPTVAAAFLAADLVDELWLHQAPVLLGAGAASVAALGVETLAAASRWRGDPVGVAGGAAVAPVGEDIRWHLRPASRAATDQDRGGAALADREASPAPTGTPDHVRQARPAAATGAAPGATTNPPDGATPSAPDPAGGTATTPCRAPHTPSPEEEQCSPE